MKTILIGNRHVSLGKGLCSDGGQQLCVVAAAAALRSFQRTGKLGSPTSHVPCVCPMLRAILIYVNDGPWWRNQDDRTETLGPWVSGMFGTRDPKKLMQRVFKLIDGAVRQDAADALQSEHAHPALSYLGREWASWGDDREIVDAASMDKAMVGMVLADSAGAWPEADLNPLRVIRTRLTRIHDALQPGAESMLGGIRALVGEIGGNVADIAERARSYCTWREGEPIDVRGRFLARLASVYEVTL